MTGKNDILEAPEHLHGEAKSLWDDLIASYDFEVNPASVRLLRTACESFQRAQQCREAIDLEGLTLPDRFGQAKPHPLLAAERDARSQFLQSIRALDLEAESEKRKVGSPTAHELFLKKQKGKRSVFG